MTQQDTRLAERSTVAQLKADIDAGRTGDKVSNADPGLSPLCTDDEAAGNPATAERIDRARRTETRIGAQSGPPVRDDVGPKGASVGIMIAVVVVLAIVILGVAFFR